jgi:hypothetical protein
VGLGWFAVVVVVMLRSFFERFLEFMGGMGFF